MRANHNLNRFYDLSHPITAPLNVHHNKVNRSLSFQACSAMALCCGKTDFLPQICKKKQTSDKDKPFANENDSQWYGDHTYLHSLLKHFCIHGLSSGCMIKYNVKRKIKVSNVQHIPCTALRHICHGHCYYGESIRWVSSKAFHR